VIDVSTYTSQCVAETIVRPRVATLKASMILRIVWQVRDLVASGHKVLNLTIGDFDPKQYPIPKEIQEEVTKAYRDGYTNYPPADGALELREAIDELYQRNFGLRYGPDAIVIGSGARPPLFATFSMFVDEGEASASFLPSWNNSYYAELMNANHQYVATSAQSNFHPTVEQVQAILPNIQLLALNSPLNPTGTVIDPSVLEGIARAVVNENERRRGTVKRPVMMLFDQVYWMLVAEGYVHKSPVQLVPEVAPYVVHIDAISKCFAATGLRVGWGVLSPELQPKMKALIGHTGAWAAYPEQIATAKFLRRPDLMKTYMADMQHKVSTRLRLLYQGIMGMKDRGLPVDAIAPQGALYLSFYVGLIGTVFQTNEDIRNFLLLEAGVAVVPFQAFDMPVENGWFRMSVGTCSLTELSQALEQIERAIQKVIG
jgi:aspartate aminotransferase